MDTTAIQTLLMVAGWPLVVDGFAGPRTTQAVRDFQFGFTFTDLEVDGRPGPKTQAALIDCVQNVDGRPPGACAEFFTFGEFASKGDGWIKVHPVLLNRLDELRRRTGPVGIISGYRDPMHNASVGGARNSQHVLACAADLRRGVSVDVATECGFSGIGVDDGKAIHVDVRAEGPNNTTGAAVGRPTIWYYY